MLPDAHAYLGGDFILQDDNDSKHRCKIVMQWKEDFDVESLPWPAQSPDMNPIEHLWDHVKRAIAARPSPPQNLKELREAIQDEWRKIDLNYVKLCQIFDSQHARPSCHSPASQRSPHSLLILDAILHHFHLKLLCILFCHSLIETKLFHLFVSQCITKMFKFCHDYN